MLQTAEQDTAPKTIEATLDYLADGQAPVSVVGAPGGVDVRVGSDSDLHRVVLRNGRLEASQFALERNGFRFVRHDTGMADFYDEDEVRSVYYAEMEALIKAESGASRVVVFDHTLRTEDVALRETRKIREVVRRVHNDYTEWSAPQRVRDLVPDEAEALLKGRFAIIQVWRPIRLPVESFPLAICDARSLSPENLVVTKRRYQERVGETYAITFNPAHQCARERPGAASAIRPTARHHRLRYSPVPQAGRARTVHVGTLAQASRGVWQVQLRTLRRPRHLSALSTLSLAPRLVSAQRWSARLGCGLHPRATAGSL